MSGSESASEWTYDAGVYRFCTETVEVEVDEATLQIRESVFYPTWY